ncbi:Thioredoxin-like fold [Ostreococcus tauri]|uniref:Thioredoxin-like fold n=2 Tax=Ostreococcus tauri TaxID=70448 RepID=A0A096PBJ7_OSTTA|nr:Thioredoxin-like fold [Ostreococcus tauri]CEG01993.1 Thioredoxin-like fold [Ostreococcus tauri]|eukprot:XP_003082864.2 Thioredoxin-like fold [Ostreococcus tauri]
MKLLYFPINARNVLAELLAREKGLALTAEVPAWPEYKAKTLFGQLPQLEDGAMTICQSMAIARVLARRANALGESERDFAESEMLLEKFVEVYDGLKEAHVYGKGTPKEKVADVVAALATHLEQMDGMVNAERGTVGDISAIAAVVIAKEFGVDAITAKAPKVKAYYDAKKSVVDAVCGSYSAWFKPEA